MRIFPRPPAIPHIQEPELLSAVSALTRAADLVRSAMIKATQASPEAMKVLIEHQNILLQADIVIDEFLEYMKVNGPKE